MATDLPPMGLGYDDSGTPVILVEDKQANSMAVLLEMVPGIGEADHAIWAAKAINHLAHEQTYTVIEDPARFAAWFQKRWEAENPNAEWDETAPQLHNFGMPDLSAVTAPASTDDGVVFFAVDRQLGAPYRVTAQIAASAQEADYTPMDMEPDPASTPFPTEQDATSQSETPEPEDPVDD